MNGAATCKNRLAEALDHWFRTDLGRLVREAECARMEQITDSLFGYHLLELSPACAGVACLEGSPIRHRVCLACCRAALVSAVARPEQLPVAGDSIDAVVLPHTLDFADDPRQVLREVERVLIPGGRVVIAGFNPWSLWGLWRLMPGAGRKPPWTGRFLSFSRIEDWLSLLGFEVEQVHSLLFRPPWKRAFLMRPARGMERMGARLWPRMAGVYIIVATRRVSTMTPIRLRWRPWVRAGKAGIAPVARHAASRLSPCRKKIP